MVVNEDISIDDIDINKTMYNVKLYYGFTGYNFVPFDIKIKNNKVIVLIKVRSRFLGIIPYSYIRLMPYCDLSDKTTDKFKSIVFKDTFKENIEYV